MSDDRDAGSDAALEVRTMAAFNVVRVAGQLAMTDDQGRPDLSAALLGIAQAAAMLLEASPECATPRDMRLKAVAFGDLIKSATVGLRREYDETGERVVTRLLETANMSEDQIRRLFGKSG